MRLDYEQYMVHCPAEKCRPLQESALDSGFVNRCIKKTLSHFGLSLIVKLFHQELPPANTVVSEKIINIVHVILTRPVVVTREWLSQKLPSLEIDFRYGLQSKVNNVELFCGVLLEELAVRLLIQKVICTAIPRLLLNYYCIADDSLLDHKVAKAARIAFTALLFALAHGRSMGNCPGLLTPQLLTGLLYGVWFERKTSIIELTVIHMAYDFALAVLLGGIPEGPVCRF
jgi:hypothetical protein